MSDPIAETKTAADDPVELELVHLLQSHLNHGKFYYSTTHDLTNSLQAQSTADPSVPLAIRVCPFIPPSLFIDHSL